GVFKELQGRHPLSVWILAFKKLYIAGIFLYGYRGKQAKGKRHPEESLFTKEQIGIPKPYDKEYDGCYRGKPAYAVIQVGYGYTLHFVPHALLNGNNREKPEQ